MSSDLTVDWDDWRIEVSPAALGLMVLLVAGATALTVLALRKAGENAEDRR